MFWGVGENLNYVQLHMMKLAPLSKCKVSFNVFKHCLNLMKDATSVSKIERLYIQIDIRGYCLVIICINMFVIGKTVLSIREKHCRKRTLYKIYDNKIRLKIHHKPYCQTWCYFEQIKFLKYWYAKIAYFSIIEKKLYNYFE